MRRQRWWALLLGGLFLCPLFAQSPPKQDHGPIQAELTARLNVRHLVNGDTVFARVTADWSGDDCTLRQGAILEAKVESATPQGRGTHGSKLALSFIKAQCGGTWLMRHRLASTHRFL